MKSIWPLLVLALHFNVLAMAQKNANINAAFVQTDAGAISGLQEGPVKIFKGIPFAAPPLGKNRWKAPQPVAHWKGVRACDKFGPNAMQGKPVPFGVYTAEYLIPAGAEISEDCLYLNVWTSASSTTEQQPVLVFIHGGAFVAGSGSVSIYDGTALAKKGVIVVTINYRLGLFGFLAHPDLSRESPQHTSGNYGILDQIAALHWVQNNIARFGGDPHNVTIAGQSAGSISVNVLDASPLARGLFQKMIAESGARVLNETGAENNTLIKGEEKGEQFAQSVHARDIQALRSMPAAQLMQAYKGQAGLIVDGYVLPESISAIFAARKQFDGPLLTGFNADEGNDPGKINLAGYRAFVVKQFGADTAKVFSLYPAGTDAEAKQAYVRLTRDQHFGMQNFAWARMQSDQANVFMYFFTRKVPENAAGTTASAFHTGEQPYAYGNLAMVKRPFATGDTNLSEAMQNYWVNFVKTGNPNGSGLPVWPVFTRNDPRVIIFDSALTTGIHPFNGPLSYLVEKFSAKTQK